MRDEQSESLGLIVPSCCSKIDLLFGGFLSHINSLSSLSSQLKLHNSSRLHTTAHGSQSIPQNCLICSDTMI